MFNTPSGRWQKKNSFLITHIQYNIGETQYKLQRP